MKHLPLARAVRASAAFPGLLPPVRIRLDKVIDPKAEGSRQLEDGVTLQAMLVDGGVFNNLGTEWTKRVAGYSHNSDHLIVRDAHRDPVHLHLVVDASAESGRSSRVLHEIPFLGTLYTLLQTYKSTYESTLVSARAFDQADGKPSTGLVDSRSRPGSCNWFQRLLNQESNSG